MPEPPFTELFIRIQEGDSQAFQQLFALYYDRIYSTALQYCKVEATAEDIVQESFLRVWEKRDQLSEIKSPEPWLFTIVRNYARNHFRDMANSERYKQFAAELISQEQNTPEKELISRQQKNLLDKSFELLTDKQKEVYMMSRQDGLTYDQIAAKLRIGRETVKDHIMKSLAKIKSYLLRHRNDMMFDWFIAINIFFAHTPLFD